MFSTFLAKEFTEIARTWRIWVVPGMLVFFAITSPIIALVTPSLVASLAGSQPGVVIELPPPVDTDAYLQFFKNLNQIVIIAIIIASAGAISGERSSGTAILVLTKPLSRRAFVLAKIVSQQSALIAATTLSAIVCIAVTHLLFDPAPVGRFLAGVSLWIVFAMFVIVLTTLLSAAFASRGAAIGVGLSFYFLAMVLGVWQTASNHTFAGLPGAGPRLLTGTGEVQVSWPLATAIVGGFVLAELAVAVFRRKEI